MTLCAWVWNLTLKVSRGICGNFLKLLEELDETGHLKQLQCKSTGQAKKVPIFKNS